MKSYRVKTKGTVVVKNKCDAFSKVEMREGAAGCPRPIFKSANILNEEIHTGWYLSSSFLLCSARIIQRLLGLGLSQLAYCSCGDYV